MTDDLVKRFVEQLRQAGGEAGVQCDECLPLADAIEALTADNARLRKALTGIKRAAAHRMQDDKKDLHSYYFYTADAALNTGK